MQKPTKKSLWNFTFTAAAVFCHPVIYYFNMPIFFYITLNKITYVNYLLTRENKGLMMTCLLFLFCIFFFFLKSFGFFFKLCLFRLTQWLISKHKLSMKIQRYKLFHDSFLLLLFIFSFFFVSVPLAVALICQSKRYLL